ncbi:MAG: hypothetical protein JNL57_07515 [Bacteroidetes bacterium]|nr:hypothetical protein [Bacteroidota bacterium]
MSNIGLLICVFTLMSITGLAGALLRILSFGTLIPFNQKYLISWSSRVTLKMIGMQLELPDWKPSDDRLHFITFNHNSYLDIFALTALSMPNTRFLLSEKTIRIIPFTLSAIAIGVYYIPQQFRPQRRLWFFKKMEKRIKNRQVNIAGSSEGVHDHHHGIDRFNRGVYHMALVCDMVIDPLYIHIPEESNPFSKYKPFARGKIQVFKLDSVDTRGWTLEHLDAHKDSVRELYVRKFNALNEKQVS